MCYSCVVRKEIGLLSDLRRGSHRSSFPLSLSSGVCVCVCVCVLCIVASWDFSTPELKAKCALNPAFCNVVLVYIYTHTSNAFRLSV